MSHPLDEALADIVHEVDGVRLIGDGSAEAPYVLDPEDLAHLHNGGPCHCRPDGEQ
ncbi:hypothetical protein [[Kitasatospora] papulosa]|uniref:hypothetical protein n=1 Tax=[Kitasatospora] papulosa TaxID=1464011 RepID=UPI0036BDED2F